MTTIPAAAAPPVQLWSTMPGWGIAADLTPPELTNLRELKRLRRWLAAGLIVLLVACIGGYVLAALKHSAASSALNKVQSQTVELQAGVNKYADVTQIQSNIGQIQTQVATLMGSDVDLVKLMTRFRTALPASMTIAAEAITIDSVAGTVTSTSGLPTIAAVTISGSGRELDNLATYVDNLIKIPGVVDVNPTSNVLDGRTARFSVSLNLTAVAFSHRFDVSKTRTK